ncbi:MAG: hypothetical protein ACKPIC_01465, partial [Microcystis panniformis]
EKCVLFLKQNQNIIMDKFLLIKNPLSGDSKHNDETPWLVLHTGNPSMIIGATFSLKKAFEVAAQDEIIYGHL